MGYEFLFFIQVNIEHRKLAVDLADIIIKWELMRLKEEQENTDPQVGNQLSFAMAENSFI